MKKSTVFFCTLATIILFLSSCQSNFSVSYTGDYCEDGLQDRDEEDVDCGGQYCDDCDGSEDGTTLSADCGGTAYTITAGESISFDGSRSSGSGTLTYSWDFNGDGSEDTSSVTYDYGYDDTGTYTVTLTVTDEEGNEETCTATVDVVEEHVYPTGTSCSEDDDDDNVYDEDDIYTGATTTITTTYSDSSTATEEYTDICSGTDLTEYACSDDGKVLTTITVTCAFWCDEDGVACVEDGIDYDFDDDGLTDKEEATYGTYPTITDSDYDGLTDYEEVMTYLTKPMDRDSDDDWLRDDHEIMQETNPLEADTDADGLGDYVEVKQTTGYFTRAYNPDTDEDAYLDGEEVAKGSDPTDPDSHAIEVTDDDGDGLTNTAEAFYGTTTTNIDSDDDGLTDYDEIMTYGTNPNDTDSDGDLSTDYDEIITYGSDPNDTDSPECLSNDYCDSGAYELCDMTFGLYTCYVAECSDGEDNDGDELVDYSEDPSETDGQCSSYTDNDEAS